MNQTIDSSNLLDELLRNETISIRRIELFFEITNVTQFEIMSVFLIKENKRIILSVQIKSSTNYK